MTRTHGTGEQVSAHHPKCVTRDEQGKSGASPASRCLVLDGRGTRRLGTGTGTIPDHSRMKPVELEGLTLSQLSALSLLEISEMSELEPGEPTSASSNFLLRPALAIASIWPRFAWRAGGRQGGCALPPAFRSQPPELPAGSPHTCRQGKKL